MIKNIMSQTVESNNIRLTYQKSGVDLKKIRNAQGNIGSCSTSGMDLDFFAEDSLSMSHLPIFYSYSICN